MSIAKTISRAVNFPLWSPPQAIELSHETSIAGFLAGDTGDVGSVAAGAAGAAGPAAGRTATPVRDVALGDDSALAGLVSDPRGRPLPGLEVLVMQSGHPAARTTTSADGRFRFIHLKGGIYEITVAGSGGIYRVWSREAAPPGAAGSILVVADGDAVRGQSPRTGFFRSDAFLISAAVLGAVAVPIVILAARRETPPAS